MQYYSTERVEDALGKLSIIANIDELQRPTNAIGLLAPIRAHLRTTGIGIVMGLASIAMVAITDFSRLALLGALAIPLVVIFLTRSKFKRVPAPVDERRVAIAALSKLYTYVDRERMSSLSIMTRDLEMELEVFVFRSLAKPDEGAERPGLDDFSFGDPKEPAYNRPTRNLLKLRLRGNAIEATLRATEDYDAIFEYDVATGDEHATELAEAAVGQWLDTELRKHFEAQGNADTGAVALSTRQQGGSPREPEAMEVKSSSLGYTPPSRLVAAAAMAGYTTLYLIPSFIIMLGMVASVIGIAADDGEDTLFGAAVMAAVFLCYVACVYNVHVNRRPAKTESRDVLPLTVPTVFALKTTGQMSAQVANDPADRVEIDLGAPFSTTLTRSADGMEPMMATLELRQDRKRIRFGAKLADDSSDGDFVERLPQWGADAQCLDGEDFARLSEAIAFYAEAHGRPLEWSASGQEAGRE